MREPLHVLLGVSGGIAAYKSAELVRELQRHGAEVRVIMTRSAEEFVRPLTFATLSGHKVFGSLWEAPADAAVIEHIAQAQWADVLLVAPATANTLAKFAAGLADDFLSATYLATRAAVVLAPAMNSNMWEHEATSENVARLERRGHTIVRPGVGELACGMTGAGRLAETEAIVRAVLERARPQHDLEGETMLVTAGGTREAIDPVRFVGNRSSGKMGYALAAAARRRGARVILISAAKGLATPEGCELVAVETAAEMHAAALRWLPKATIVLKAAAVADFRVRSVAEDKLRREGLLTLELEPTEDIVRSMVEQKAEGTVVIAFAAEMGLDVERAREKLRRKGVDAIVLNDISRREIGFDSERNAGVFVTRDGERVIEEASKEIFAGTILDQLPLLRSRSVLVG